MEQERYVIHVTKACNMKCTYCYEKDKISTYSWEEIKKFCEKIIFNNNDEIEYSVEFLGGEPCLAWDHIEKAVQLFKQKDPDHCAYFVITTNGTIVNERIIDFLINNSDVMFSVSLDGIPEANTFRMMKADNKNSYGIVAYNLAKLRAFGVPQNQLSAHMVTHIPNMNDIYNSVADLYRLGIRNISVGTVERMMVLTDSYFDTFVKELNRVADEIVYGKWPDLNIDILQTFNPEKKKGRIYMYDASGKMVGESYAEAENDITKTNEYLSNDVDSIDSDRIFEARKKACLYYRELVEKKNAQEGNSRFLE